MTESKLLPAPVSVVSAAVFRDSTMSEVLLGVRRPTPLVKRHPGVLSTLTIGVPDPIFELLSANLALPPRNGALIKINNSQSFAVGNAGYLGNIHAFVLEALLAKKAGMAKALIAGDFVARGQMRTISMDTVSDPLGTDEDEWTRMLTYSLTVERGADRFPESTSSYSRLLWVRSADVAIALERHDALLLDSTLDPFEVCIHGLCVRSVVAALES